MPHIGVLPGFLLDLSNLSVFLSGKPEQLCASDPKNCHTLEVRKGSMRFISLINPEVEPRALLSGTAASTEHVYRTVCVQWRAVVYPG